MAQTLFFPSKLIKWASDPLLEHVQWISVDGKMCVYIADKLEFAKQCYGGNYENFRRQLSEYHFTKVHLFKGHKENYNRAVYHREGFFPGADVSSLRKEIMKAKKQSSAPALGVTPVSENDILSDYCPELACPPFAALLRNTEFADCLEHSSDWSQFNVIDATECR